MLSEADLRRHEVAMELVGKELDVLVVLVDSGLKRRMGGEGERREEREERETIKERERKRKEEGWEGREGRRRPNH